LRVSFVFDLDRCCRSEDAAASWRAT